MSSRNQLVFDLKEAKEAVEAAPNVVGYNMRESEATQFVNDLREQGATSSLQQSKQS